MMTVSKIIECNWELHILANWPDCKWGLIPNVSIKVETWWQMRFDSMRMNVIANKLIANEFDSKWLITFYFSLFTFFISTRKFFFMTFFYEKQRKKKLILKKWSLTITYNWTKWPAGSLFYSIIIISTIGYGDQTPKTQWGKVKN